MRIGRLVNSVLNPMGLNLSRVNEATSRHCDRYDAGPGVIDGLDQNTRKVLNVVGYTKLNNISYSAAGYDAAYHTVTLGGRTFAGQRNPASRLADVPFDFTGATVLDVGCNQGGMLFALSDKIGHGVGIDYDSRMINSANRMRSHKSISNLDFYVFDLEKENLHFVNNLLPFDKVDIVFLLSVCMWIRNWREILKRMPAISTDMLFETNGAPEQQQAQEDAIRDEYRIVELIRGRSDDDSRQASRQLFLCSNQQLK